MRRLKLGGTGRVWIYNATLASLAAGLSFGVVGDLDAPGSPHRVPWWALTALFFLAESLVVHIHLRREALTYSLSEIPLVLGLFLAEPSQLITARLAGSAIALIVRRRQAPAKAAFNLAQFSLETCLALVAFHQLVGGDPAAPRAWLAALASTLLGVLATNASISLAISLSEGRLRLRTLTHGLWFGTLVAVTNTSIALIVVTVMRERPSAAWLLLIPAATLLGAYHTYVSQRRQHETLKLLYRATRAVNQSDRLEPTMVALLEQAREIFGADVAEIILFAEWSQGAPARTSVGPEGSREVMRPVAPRPLEREVAALRKGLRIPRPIADEGLRRELASRGLRDAMIAPLFDEDRVVGSMLVGDRLGDVGTFTEDDLQLLETLANHASVSLVKARLVDRLEESLAQQTELHRVKDDFLATVSHELRTPLTSIQGFIKTLLRPGLAFRPEQYRSLLQIVDRQGERLGRLIEDLLLTSKIQSEDVHTHVTSFCLASLTRQLAEEFRATFQDRTIETVFERDVLIVESDGEKVHQVLANLVGNAIKYSPPGSTVTVRSRLHEGGARIDVRDGGRGIPEHLREKIFDRFYQIDQSSTRAVGGVGLGLYICRRLAEAVGGRVWLERSDETGSTFSLWIPLKGERGQRTPVHLDGGEIVVDAPSDGFRSLTAAG